MKRRVRLTVVYMVLMISLLLRFPADVRASGNTKEGGDAGGGEDLLEEFEFDDIDDSLRELFPGERLKFKDTLMGVLSGDMTFSASLFGRLVADQLSYTFRSGRDNLVRMLLIDVIAAVFSNFSKLFLSALKYPQRLEPSESIAINESFNCGAKYSIKSRQIGVHSSPSSTIKYFISLK